ncbi:hypothetical protein HBI23_222690 [Parastagonospora nodorum]|nr:hypothetical protein HBI23_222690 [Parastagonospora nodorum]KAH6194726.1 hypothetical protein HBI15_228650 [Parastagonospora nodorum]
MLFESAIVVSASCYFASKSAFCDLVAAALCTSNSYISADTENEFEKGRPDPDTSPFFLGVVERKVFLCPYCSSGRVGEIRMLPSFIGPSGWEARGARNHEGLVFMTRNCVLVTNLAEVGLALTGLSLGRATGGRVDNLILRRKSRAGPVGAVHDFEMVYHDLVFLRVVLSLWRRLPPQ